MTRKCVELLLCKLVRIEHYEWCYLTLLQQTFAGGNFHIVCASAERLDSMTIRPLALVNMKIFFILSTLIMADALICIEFPSCDTLIYS